THYPFLVNRMRKTAPWPVDWIDTSEAIARRALTLAQELSRPRPAEGPDIALFTSRRPAANLLRLFAGFGFRVAEENIGESYTYAGDGRLMLRRDLVVDDRFGIDLAVTAGIHVISHQREVVFPVKPFAGRRDVSDAPPFGVGCDAQLLRIEE